ncbi:MAG TPA: C40 family peptidase [Chthonomonadaceae bacterium]|nr:C40 family peptidase [Chthonomonadaceae bacterium]
MRSYLALSRVAFVCVALLIALCSGSASFGQNGMPGIRVTPKPISLAEKAASKPVSRGQHLADTAIAYLGCPYKWGGDSPKTGMDCSGLIVAACKQWGISMPHSVVEQFKQGKPVARDQLQPGDIVFFKDTYKPGLSHVAMYVGDNRYVAAGDEKAGVVMFEFGPEGEAHYAGARRLDVSKLPPVIGERQADAGSPSTPPSNKSTAIKPDAPKPPTSNGQALVNIRVCADTGDRATSACPSWRVVKTTADQASHMKPCAKHHPASSAKP